MRTFSEPIRPVIVASGQTGSTVLTAELDYADAVGISIGSPSGLTEAATIQASYDYVATNPGAATWLTVEEGDGSDMTIPDAGKARGYYSLILFPAIRILLGGAAGADRTFMVNKIFQT